MFTYEPRKYVDSIIIGGYNVLEYCRKTHVDRIIYTQTINDISLYDHDIVLKPDMKRNFSYTGDHAVYVISKNTMLEFLEHYHQEYGLKKFIFRLPSIYSYSPYQYCFWNGNKTIRFLYQIINKALNGETIEVWGDPSYQKDMVHVYDLSQMLCRAVLVNRRTGFYNVGTGMPVTMLDQVKTIIDVFSPKDKRSEITFRPDKPNTGGFLLDISNAQEELGYVPQYDCRKLFENFREEMKVNRFSELRQMSI
jgi:UDP-glucose 4-epimerase